MLNSVYLILRVAGAIPGVTDFWGWATASLPAGAVINGLGLGSLAILFATDRVLTKGQHLRRVDDINIAHAKEVKTLEAGRDSRISDLNSAQESRVQDLKAEMQRAEDRHKRELEESERRFAYEQAAKDTERKRADEATSKLAVVAGELGSTAVKLISALPKYDGDAG